MLARPMNQGIKIKVISEPDDDGLYKYQISLSNGNASTSLEFWGYEDNFRGFGAGLIDFPSAPADIVTYELGEDAKGKFAYYMLLSAACFDKSGRSAIKVVIDNHGDLPEHQRCEFYIESMPSELNRLGEKILNWSPKTEKEFTWDARFN